MKTLLSPPPLRRSWLASVSRRAGCEGRAAEQTAQIKLRRRTSCITNGGTIMPGRLDIPVGWPDGCWSSSRSLTNRPARVRHAAPKTRAGGCRCRWKGRALWGLFRSRKLLQAQPDHLDHGLGSSGANRLCDPLLCNRENVVDIILSDRAASAQNIKK
jgi:hypothetical protein